MKDIEERIRELLKEADDAPSFGGDDSTDDTSNDNSPEEDSQED